MAMSRKAVFLDKDGTLIENHPFDRSPEHIEWVPGTIEGLRLLHHSGYALIVVSNQGEVAQGRFTVEDLLREELALRAELAKFARPSYRLLLLSPSSGGHRTLVQRGLLLSKTQSGSADSSSQ